MFTTQTCLHSLPESHRKVLVSIESTTLAFSVSTVLKVGTVKTSTCICLRGRVCKPCSMDAETPTEQLESGALGAAPVFAYHALRTKARKVAFIWIANSPTAISGTHTPHGHRQVRIAGQLTHPIP